jgi:hypothetical protein
LQGSNDTAGQNTSLLTIRGLNRAA